MITGQVSSFMYVSDLSLGSVVVVFGVEETTISDGEVA